MSALALPEPQALTAVEWATQAREARAICAEHHDLAGAHELHRRLAAVRSYLDDKASRMALEAEQRRTEVLIGELLGPAQNGGAREPLPTMGSEISHSDRQRFRSLAEHAEQVEALIREGYTKRAQILARLSDTEPESEHHCPTCGARIPKNGIARRLRNRGEAS